LVRGGTVSLAFGSNSDDDAFDRGYSNALYERERKLERRVSLLESKLLAIAMISRDKTVHDTMKVIEIEKIAHKTLVGDKP
jgi:hypothetical protein